MAQLGQMIIYDKSNGNIAYGENCNILGEYSDTGPDIGRPTDIDFITLPYGSTVLHNVATFHVDITKDKTVTPAEQMIVIDSTIVAQPTYEQLQQELLQSQGVI